MGANLIELLKDRVSPLVLKSDSTHIVEKDQALSQFYPVLLTILRARPVLIHELNGQLHPTLSTLLQNNVSLKNQLLAKLGQQVPPSHLENLLEQSITPSLNFIAGEAGASSPQAISNLLDQHAETIQQYLPHWVGPLLSSMGISVPSVASSNSNASEKPLYTQSNPDQVQEGMRKNTWIPFIILLLLAAAALFLYKQCSQAEDIIPAASSEVTPQN